MTHSTNLSAFAFSPRPKVTVTLFFIMSSSPHSRRKLKASAFLSLGMVAEYTSLISIRLPSLRVSFSIPNFSIASGSSSSVTFKRAFLKFLYSSSALSTSSCNRAASFARRETLSSFPSSSLSILSEEDVLASDAI